MISPERVVEKKKRSLFSNDFLIEICGVPDGVKVGKKFVPICYPVDGVGYSVIKARSIGWNCTFIEFKVNHDY